ncbi:class I SAM-dependent methyltransferase [Solimonas terrae]|uniref:Class I SAM-dependent methyltransferase n=1 Tax=Solimonas terrae TaxID=1396819 RepID=A0A6M2BRT6_9GAMM|nr:class I SAM-dependent methyltransferase [Solimonas terrae]NGY04813.1 class I SAM-dependent methyltransferase [Solimonas terrae]
MAREQTARVSPTAYATGYFWFRQGMSHPAFATPQGKRLDRAFRVLTGVTRRLSGFSLDALMLARHKGIDAQLSKAIDSGRIGQVIEIAAGLSPRGWSFMQRYGDRLRYIETDLPTMAACKRALLLQTGSLSERHQLVELDALSSDGPDSLAAVAKRLDPDVGTAIITEGLMNYLDPASARGVWQRIAETLGGFPQGVYFSDVYFNERVQHPAVIAFGALLSAFVKGRMHVHFKSPRDLAQILKGAGFKRVRAVRTDAIAATREYASQRGGDSVRVLEAWA